VLFTLKTEGHQRQPITVSFAKDFESTTVQKAFGKMISSVGQVGHDLGKASFAQSNQDIVLSNDVSSTFTKVESEGSLYEVK
jgi:hypothetical protein